MALPPSVRIEALVMLPGASAKRALLLRVTPAAARRPRYLPAPPPGGTSLTSLLQPPPSCPWHTSPYLLDKAFYGRFMEQRDSAARSVAGCCKKSIHSTSCASVPANPLFGVRAPAHTLWFLSPPWQLVCPMICIVQRGARHPRQRGAGGGLLHTSCKLSS